MAVGIIGASGFIGSRLLEHLISTQSRRVRILLRNVRASEDYCGAEIMCGDLHSPVDCERFVDGLEVIYYLAHCNTPINSDLDQANDAYLNLIPLLNLLKAVRARKTSPHVVYFSSGGAVYGRKTDSVAWRETDPSEPLSSYGIQKLAAEHYLRLAAERGELTAVALRISNAYGKLLRRERMQGLIGIAVNNVLHGLPIQVFGNPDNVRDYVHLRDVCAIAVRAASVREPFDIVNIGSGRGYSVRDVVRIIQENASGPVRIEVEHQQCDKWLTNWVVLDVSKAAEKYGWSPSVDLPAGIREMMGLPQ